MKERLSPYNLVYSLYKRNLKRKVKAGRMPKHVGLILDGNRRGASRLGISKERGYKIGANKLEEVLEWAWDLDIKAISVWIFSTENFQRSDEEKEVIFRLAKENAIKIREDKRVHERGIQVRFSGEIGMLPESLQEEFRKTEDATKDYTNYILNICVAYGGRKEIVHAVRKIAKHVKEGKLDIYDIDEELIASHLYTTGLPDPDLIIRTSGEVRLSGFLLWQGVYSELYFTDVYWPLFREIDFLRAIRSYQLRHRRFGK